MNTDEGSIVARVFVYSIMAVALVAGLALLWGEARPAFMDQDHEANIHSHQYVESQRTAILNNVEECRRLNTRMATLTDEGGHESTIEAIQSQRTAIAARVRTASAQIPSDGRPVDISACQ